MDQTESLDRDGLESALTDAGIDLPPGWGKMSLSRKATWTKTALNRQPTNSAMVNADMADAEKRVIGHIGHVGFGEAAAAVAASALTSFGRRLRGEDPPRAKKKSWPANLSKRVVQKLAARKAAPDPETMTRQVRRQNERRSDKLLRSNLKAQAMKGKVQGGAAVIGMADVRHIRENSGYNAHT